MDYLNKILYYKIPENWEHTKKRDYKFINTSFVISFILSVIFIGINVGFHILEAALLHGILAFIYLAGFYLTTKISLRQIRYFLLYSLKIPIFIYSLFIYHPAGNQLIPYFSPVIILFVIFPVIAALFELPLKYHIITTLLLIASNFIILPFIPGSFVDIMPELYSEGLLMITCSVFAVFVTGVFTHEICFRQNIYKEKEKLQAETLQSTVQDLYASLNKLETQKVQIEKQSEELQKLNHTKDKLFTIIAHDLRSPFNSIIGFIELLKLNSYNKIEQQRIINILHESANNAYFMINNLLAWSQSQLGTINVVQQWVNLNESASNYISLYSSIAVNKNLFFINNVPDDTNIVTDPNLLGTILRNLLTNAIKYSNKGGTIEVSTTKMGNEVKITIKDNGIGMKPETVTGLLNCHEITSQPGTANEKGTGIGFVICQEFAQKLNGKIAIDSTLGQGSSFHIILPEKMGNSKNKP